ncbi:MAG: L,D-transpeptidase family protein [Chitinophagales bacterium]
MDDGYMLKITSTKKTLLLIFLFSGFLFACKNKKREAEKIEQTIEAPKDELEFQQKIATVLGEYIPTLKTIQNDTSKYLSWHEPVKEVYAANQYKAIWVSKDVLSPKGKEMYDYLSKAEFLGLNKELYDFESIHKLVDSLTKILPAVDFNLSKQVEVGLTRSFFQMALHIDKGMFGDTTKGINSNFWIPKKKYEELFAKAATDSVSKVLSSLEPDNPMYNRYMAALKKFVSKNNISDNPIHIRDVKFDSIGAVNDAKKALVYHHYLEDSLKQIDSCYKVALKKFQKDNNLNADGNIGANTIKALERDNSAKFQLLAINADRWRKEHIIELPKKYVWVNLPSYKLKIIEEDTLRLEKKVVIGKSNNKNETPILESAINQIVLWPTWSVPQSIVKHEMKSFKGFSVTKTGSYTQVVQPPGPRNALGCVKILFPNKYSVYIHDTPSKSTFGADLRAASHGCVRCQEPLEVAANLIMMSENDSMKIDYDSLKVLKDLRIATRTFKLKKSIPVYFRYFTAEADFNGDVKFYNDVYGRDKEMIAYIFKNKKPHVISKDEQRYLDSIAVVKKKKADSLLAEAKLKKEQEKLLTPNVNNITVTTTNLQDSNKVMKKDSL